MGKIILLIIFCFSMAQAQRPFTTNGVDGYAIITNTADILQNAGSPFSVSFWVFKRQATRRNDIVIANYASAPNAGLFLLDYPVSGSVGFSLLFNSPNAEFWGSNVEIPLHKWSHWVMVFAGRVADQTACYWYVDNVRYATATHYQNPPVKNIVSGIPIFVGGDNVWGADGICRFLIDDLIIFDTEITKEQVNYLNKNRGTVKMKGMICSLRNTGDSQRLTDASGNNRDTGKFTGCIISTMPGAPINSGRE